MLGASVVDAFLVIYLIYTRRPGRARSGQGTIRYNLLRHSHLARRLAARFCHAISTLSRGLRGRYTEHKRIAKKTFPAWMYVSVTGVIVYLMLYQM